MPILVKPISGMLTKDKDNFGKQVFTCLPRILISFYLLVNKSTEHKHTKVEENNLNGKVATPFKDMTK